MTATDRLHSMPIQCFGKAEDLSLTGGLKLSIKKLNEINKFVYLEVTAVP
jgi:hypothetical protein